MGCNCLFMHLCIKSKVTRNLSLIYVVLTAVYRTILESRLGESYESVANHSGLNYVLYTGINQYFFD